jgi:hypothetical protein
MSDEGLSDVDELEDWLSTPIVKSAMDPILFWEGMSSAGSPLSRMALNFLSIPGRYVLSIRCFFADQLPVATSTDVERAFSKGGLTVSRFRHSLSDASTRASTVLGSWAVLDEVIPHTVIPKDDIIELFKNKHKRPKKRARVEDDVEVSEVMEID